MEFVRADHLVVPEQAATQVLDGADEHEGDRLDGDHPEDQGEQPAVPLDVAQQGVDEREGDEEEADVLEAFGEVGGVERLEGVEDDDGGEDSGEPDGWVPAGGSCHG